MSVFSVTVTDVSQLVDTFSLQGHHCPRFPQRLLSLPPSIPVVDRFPWDLTIDLQAIRKVSWCFPLAFHQPLWLSESVKNYIWTWTHTFIWRCRSINRREVASRKKTVSAETAAAHNPTMTTTITASQEHLTLTHKVNLNLNKMEIWTLRGCLCSCSHWIISCNSSESLCCKSCAEINLTASLRRSSRTRVLQTATRHQEG